MFPRLSSKSEIQQRGFCPLGDVKRYRSHRKNHVFEVAAAHAQADIISTNGHRSSERIKDSRYGFEYRRSSFAFSRNS
jgi:hypothetical protein